MNRFEKAQAKRERRAKKKHPSRYAQHNTSPEAELRRNAITGEIELGPLELNKETGELEHTGGRAAARMRNELKRQEGLEAFAEACTPGAWEDEEDEDEEEDECPSK